MTPPSHATLQFAQTTPFPTATTWVPVEFDATASQGWLKAGSPLVWSVHVNPATLIRVKSRRAIDEALALVRADPTDIRSRLKLGDLYAKVGDLPNALEQYEWVANYYVHLGFALKAIAVYKQICSIVARDAQQLRHRYAHVPPILADLFERLGVHNMAVHALDALGPDPSSRSHGPS